MFSVYEEQEDPESRSFFSEIIASISDIKFSPDGRYIIARDFLTLKIWDVNMDSRPVQTINVRRGFWCVVSLCVTHMVDCACRSMSTCVRAWAICTRATASLTSSNAL